MGDSSFCRCDYSAFSYRAMMSLRVLWRGLAGMLPLFMASAAMAGILSAVTPTSDSRAGMPSSSFRQRISYTSIMGWKSSPAGAL